MADQLRTSGNSLRAWLREAQVCGRAAGPAHSGPDRSPYTSRLPVPHPVVEEDDPGLLARHEVVDRRHVDAGPCGAS